ncbi:MAG TPA: LacI family DNA-binding transcriptional regulator [Clostridia bacterium]|nr:LacI family DNA-binding transcriptional regulator [Clostridia bacterium]
MKLTIKDIARMSNVSCTTVSRVLNNKPDVKPETRQTIMELIEKHRFQPNAFAKGISSKKSNCIGLVIPYEANYVLGNPFYAEVIEGILNELNKRSYYLMFCYYPKVDFIEYAFTQNRVDGFVLLSPMSHNKNVISLLHEMGAPFVATSRILNEENVVYVDIDNHLGGYMAVEHLISLGHRKIGMIRNGPGNLASSESRFDGYKAALAKYNIPFDPDLVEIQTSSVDNGYNAMNNIFDRGMKPTGIFAASDMMAIGAANAIKEHGMHIPEDMSIVGFDDIKTAQYYNPPLTTIRQRSFEKGKKLAHLMINLLEKKKNVKSILLDVELVVRKSTGELGK